MSPSSDLPLWALDTEDDSKGRPFMFNFYDGRDHHTFKTRREAVEFLLSIGRAQIWACNCEYDINNLFGDEYVEILERTYLKSAFVKARVFNVPKVRIVFYDTMRQWKLGVARMGEKLGFPKLPFDPQNPVYCRRDTEIVWKWVDRQRKLYKTFGAELKSTIGSAALDLWKRRFARHSPELSARYLPLCAGAVRGGRVEIFKTGLLHGRIECFDINSMYPFVMKNRLYPVLSSARGTLSPDWSKLGAARVTLDYPSLEIPALPWKSPASRKLIFPTGRLEGTWTYPEIRQALADGAKIVKLHDAVEFSEECRPFSGYIDDLYERRKASKDDIERDTLKNFMNNLFGKFGARNSLEIWKGIERYEREMRSKEANQIWAACITAYARLYLLESLRRYKKWLLYCDTDSIFLLDGPDVECGDELGAWKKVGRWRTADFVLPKVYMLAEQGERYVKAKGIPRRAMAEFYDKADGAIELPKRTYTDQFYDEGKAMFEAPVRFRESFKRGIKANVWISKTRTLNQKYDKRLVLAGGSTVPIRI